MTWNYRIIHKNIPFIMGDRGSYQIHEVYYKKNGKIYAYTQNPVGPFGESKKELIECLKMMLKDAKNKPVLEWKALEKKFKKRKEKR